MADVWPSATARGATGDGAEKVLLQSRVDALSVELEELRAAFARAAAVAAPCGGAEAPGVPKADPIFRRLEELRATSEGLSGRIEHIASIVEDQARRIAALERRSWALAADGGPQDASQHRPRKATAEAEPPPPWEAPSRHGGLRRAAGEPQGAGALSRAGAETLCAGRAEAVTWSFHRPGPGDPYTRPYEEAKGPGALAFAAVAPGDEMLFVGGGGHNGAIARLLSGECQEPQDVDRYLELHQQLLEQTRAEAPGTLVPAGASTLRSHGALEWSGCRLFEGAFKSFGVVFVHIFTAACRPLGQHNVALVYTVGPIGKSSIALGGLEDDAERIGDVIHDPSEFGAFLRNTAASVIASVCEYNAKVARQHALPQIRVLRMPLVSGGTLRHPSLSKVDCAQCILTGIQDAAAGLLPDAVPLEVNFAFDEGCFEEAAAQLRRFGPAPRAAGAASDAARGAPSPAAEGPPPDGPSAPAAGRPLRRLGLQELLDLLSMVPEQLSVARQAVEPHGFAQARCRAVADAAGAGPKEAAAVWQHVVENLKAAGSRAPAEAALGAAVEIFGGPSGWKHDSSGRADNPPAIDGSRRDLPPLSAEAWDAVRRLLFANYPPERLLAASTWAEQQELGEPSAGAGVPVAVLAVGPPGSGKSHLLAHDASFRALQEQFGVPPREQCVLIDTDAPFASICDNDTTLWPLARFESHAALLEAAAARRHLLVEGAGEDLEHTCGRVLSRLKQVGYRILICVVLASFECCRARLAARGAQAAAAARALGDLPQVFERLQKSVSVYLEQHAALAEAVFVFSSETSSRGFSRQQPHLAYALGSGRPDRVESARLFAQGMLSLDRQVGRHHDLWPAPLSGCGYVNPAGSDPLGSTAAAASAALSGVLQQALGHGQPPQQADLNGVQDAPLGGHAPDSPQAATTRAAAGQPPWQQPWPPDVVCPRRAAGPPLDGLACSPIAPVMAVGASVDGHAGLSPFSPDRFRNPLRLASQDQVPINAMHVDYAGAALPTVGWAMRNLSPRRALGSTPRVEAPPSRAATPPGLPAARFALDARVPTCSPEAAPGLGGAPPQWAFGAGAAAVAGVASTQPWRAAEGTAAGHAAVLLASESHQSA